jgi:hypothetical protein
MVFVLAGGYLVARLVERRVEGAEARKITQLLEDATRDISFLRQKASEKLPPTDPVYQEVQRIAESAASSVAQANAEIHHYVPRKWINLHRIK